MNTSSLTAPGTPEGSPPTVRRTLIGAAFLSIQPLALNALSVPAMAYIIHQLGPERYAQWAASVGLLAFLTVLTNLGLRAAFVRTVAGDPGAARNALADQLGLRVTLSIVAGSIALVACVLLGYSGTVVGCAALGALGLVLTSAATTLGDLVQATHRIRSLAIVNLISGLALTAASVAAATAGAGPLGMAAAYITGPAVSAVLLAVHVQRRVCPVSLRWSAARFRGLLVQSRFLAAHQLLFAGSGHVEALLSPRLLGMQTFGVFAAGAMLANRLVALPDALCAAAYPVMAAANRRGSGPGGLIMLRYLAIVVAGSLVIAGTGTALAGPLGRLLLPAEADVFAFVVRVTIWSLPLIGIELVLGYSLSAAGRDSLQARLAVHAAAISLVGSIGLVVWFGIEGACWSMLFRPAVRASFLAGASIRTFGAASRSMTAVGASHAGSILPMRKAG